MKNLLIKKQLLIRERRRRKIRNIILIIALIQLIFNLWWISRLKNDSSVDPVHKNMPQNEN
jgi:cell division protein FtsB